LCETHNVFLNEIRVNFKLKDCGTNPSVAKEVDDQGSLEVADADAFSKADINEGLHCLPSFLDRGFPLRHFTFGVLPPNGV